MKQPDRLFAYRLLMLRGEWDVDGFFASIPEKKWQELKIAKAINDSYDEWVEAVGKGYKKSWKPPTFKPRTISTGRRRLDGTPY